MDFIKKRVIAKGPSTGNTNNKWTGFSGNEGKPKVNFVKDMKKHGIASAINEVKNFSLIVGNSPDREGEE